MATLVGSQGEVLIEDALRTELGIGPGWHVVQQRVGDHIELRFLPPRHRRSLRGVLSRPEGPHFTTDAELQTAIEEAWHTEMRRDTALADGTANQDRGAVGFPDALLWAEARSASGVVHTFDEKFPSDGVPIVRP